AMGVPLDDGRVFIFGGRDANGSLSSSEVYDPSTGQWSQGPDLVNGRYDASSLVTPAGLMVMGGAAEQNRTTNPEVGNVDFDELLDPNQGIFVAASSRLNNERSAAAGAVTDAGDTFVAGGTD